jgi:hypothetical protein
MRIVKIILTLIMFASIVPYSFSQKAETWQFEKIKGKLPFPVCSVYGFSDLKCNKGPICTPRKNITFITDSAAEVRAIHNGQVCAVYNIEKEYAVVTRFGDYYITYYPLTKTKLKKGDTIINGQPLAKISSADNAREINILMSKNTKFIDPYKWFKW